MLALLGWIQLSPYLQLRRNYCPKHRLWKELVTQMQRYAVSISLAQGRQKSGQNSKLFSTFRTLTICIFWFTLFRNWIHFLMPIRAIFEFIWSISHIEWPRLWRITDLSLVVNKEGQKTMKMAIKIFLAFPSF